MSCIYSFIILFSEHSSYFQAHQNLWWTFQLNRMLKGGRATDANVFAFLQQLVKHFLLLHPITLTARGESPFQNNLPHFPRLAYEPPIVQLQWSAWQRFAESSHILSPLYCIAKKDSDYHTGLPLEAAVKWGMKKLWSQSTWQRRATD